jgi:hypothetical protein
MRRIRLLIAGGIVAAAALACGGPGATPITSIEVPSTAPASMGTESMAPSSMGTESMAPSSPMAPESPMTPPESPAASSAL